MLLIAATIFFCNRPKPCPFPNVALCSSLPCQFSSAAPIRPDKHNKMHFRFGHNWSSQRDVHQNKVSSGLRIAAYYVSSQSTMEIRPLHVYSIVPKRKSEEQGLQTDTHTTLACTSPSDTSAGRRRTWSGTPTRVLALLRRLNILDAISRGTESSDQVRLLGGRRLLF